MRITQALRAKPIRQLAAFAARAVFCEAANLANALKRRSRVLSEQQLTLPNKDDDSGHFLEVLAAALARAGNLSERYLRRLPDAIAQLTTYHRVIVEARLHRGLSIQELSQELGTSYGKARREWLAALASLRAFLEQE